MQSIIKTLRSAPADLFRLALFVLGIVFIAYGAWLVYPPAGYIVGGLLMFGSAVVGAVRAGVRA